MREQFYIYYDRQESRMYSSDFCDIKRNAKIVWGLYLDYAGSHADGVRAFAAARIVSSTLFNLKLKQLPLEKICEVTWGIVQKLGLPPHLLRASDKAEFGNYANALGMGQTAAENYRLFIESLQSYDSMLAWQMHYKQIEEKTGKWNMAK